MDILRFITAGSTDDGKSTLIGRLLYESGQITKDILHSVSTKSEIKSSQGLNLAFITDGLRSERQNGITIDVAYKYFTTPARKFIVTDAPGHFQYTKNMLSGASEVDAMIVLIDVENGITEQTRRHSFIASWLAVPNIVVAINKMDKVHYDEAVFSRIRLQYLELGRDLNLGEIEVIPVSALLGDNVTARSENMTWYTGVTLMDHLNRISPHATNAASARVSIQHVMAAPGKEQAYMGKVLSGTFQTGDVISVFPGAHKTTIHKLATTRGLASKVEAGDNVSVYFENRIDARRGALLYQTAGPELPRILTHFRVSALWLDPRAPLSIDKTYVLRMNAFETECRVVKVISKLNIGSFMTYTDEAMPVMNEFAGLDISATEAVFADEFEVLPETSRGILIDPETNSTCAAFKITADIC